MAEKKFEITSYFFFGLTILFIYFTWMIVKPYITYILLGCIGVIIIYPLYKKLIKYIPYKNVVAFILVVLMVILITIPFYVLSALIIKESGNVYLGIDAFSNLSSILSSSLGIKIDIDNAAVYLLEFVRGIIGADSSNLVGRIIDVAIGIFLLCVVMFYSLTKGNVIIEWIKRYFPLKKYHRFLLIKETENCIKGFVYGQLLAAVAQGLMVALGFYIFGLNNSIFWGFVAFILSLLPVIGPAFIWIPGVVILLLTGKILNGILLALWGIIVISNVDNLMRIYAMKKKGRIHEGIVIIGAFGGIKLFGFIGILLGPLILSIFLSLLKFYAKEYGDILNK